MNASGALAVPVKVDAALSRQAVAALDREAIKTREVLALRTASGGSLSITAVKREGVWRPEEAKRAASRLTSELGLPMRAPALPDGGVSGELCFFQAPGTDTGASSAGAKESTQPPATATWPRAGRGAVC